MNECIHGVAVNQPCVQCREAAEKIGPLFPWQADYPGQPLGEYIERHHSTPPPPQTDYTGNRLIEEANKNNAYWLAFLFGFVVRDEWPSNEVMASTEPKLILVRLWEEFREIQKQNRLWFAER